MSKNKDKKSSKKEPAILSKKELKAMKKADKQSNKVDSKKVDSKKVDKKEEKTVKSSEVQNVFTAVGLAPKHRAVPFQLTRHFDEVTVAKNKAQFPYEAEVQLDSTFCAAVVHKGATNFYSRTGNLFQNCGELISKFKVKADGVYMCEITVATISKAKFEALFSPFRKNALTAPQQAILDDKSLLIVNDYITINEFTEGKSDVPYSKRKKFVKSFCKKLNKGEKKKSHRFFTPITETCEDLAALVSFREKVIGDGFKGINIRGEDNPYICGHQNYHYMQLLPYITYNLTCVGFEEGAGKDEGKVANLLFTYKDGAEIKAPLDSSYTAEDSLKMLEVLKSDGKGKKKKAKKGKKVKTASSPLGYVFEINSLEENAKGVLKLPTVGKFTKTKSDY